jgi:gamma-glutamylcyclotransferase
VHLYFAYGSNMDERDLRVLCPTSRHLGCACLDGYRLAFSRRSIVSGTGVADVAAAPGERVWGVLYELDEHDLDALDRKEGHGWAYIRERKRVRLEADGLDRDAIIYSVLSKEPSEVAPSHEYLNRLVAAAERHALPQGYIAMLEAIEHAH